MKKLSLGKRLSALYELVDADNTHFYDLCCDHGQLGFAIHETKNPLNTTLNDRVKPICDKLSRKISTNQYSKINVLNQNASEIKLDINEYKFIVVAGVGGPLVINIIKNLMNQITNKDVFLLSPHTKIHEVRKFLIENSFELIKEHYCYENGKHYEMLKVRHGTKDSNISLIGHDIWKESNQYKQNYLSEMIKYYETKLKHNDAQDIKFLLSDLKALKNKNK